MEVETVSPYEPVGSIVDVDIHPSLGETLGGILPYVPAPWAQRLDYLADTPLSASPLDFNYMAGTYVVGSHARLDARRSSADEVRREHLDRHGVGVAHLLAVDAAIHVLQAHNDRLGAALASGFNSYMLDKWVGDGRFYCALTVFPDDAATAADEIRQRGHERGVASIWLPLVAQRLGNPHFYPIYEAAAEHDLPIVVHPVAARSVMSTPAMRFEGRANAPTLAWSNIASLVASGTLERFPRLSFVFMESGFLWLPALLTRLDAAWRVRDDDLASLKRPPSQCIAEQIRLTTSPLDGDPAPEELARLIDAPDSLLPSILLFASNYPRTESWPGSLFAVCSEASRAKILAGNARAVFRITQEACQ